MSRSVESARTLTTQEGATVHVVRLEGGGFVITSGDTRIEPVVVYSPVADLDEGKTCLTDLDWMEQLSGQRYFKAFVEPK